MLPRVDGGERGKEKEKWKAVRRDVLSRFEGRNRWHDEGDGRGRRGQTITGDRKRSQQGSEEHEIKGTDWKARYKLRHNWSIGAAEVREIGLGLGMNPTEDEIEDDLGEDNNQAGKTLMARLVDGGVVTVDIKEGLRAWDLKRRESVAQCALTCHKDGGRDKERAPTCLSIDNGLERGLDTAVIVGFQDGGFEIWSLRFDASCGRGSFETRYRSPVFANDGNLDVQLSAIAYAHPYLLTITANHIWSLYVFDIGALLGEKDLETTEQLSAIKEGLQDYELPQEESNKGFKRRLIDSTNTEPRLLTSLKSHTCWPPLCLSIRSTPRTIIASIAYAVPTYLSGWSVGLQELHLTQSGTILRSRLASAVEQGFHSLLSSSAPSTPPLSQSLRPSTPEASDTPSRRRSRDRRQTPPTSLSYSHPYLLAGNSDNTLSLYLVTSNNEELKISKSTTLWGHTSSISGAQVGGRGKAVSVSARGEELRVWELEGGLGRKVVQERSVLVRREGKEGSDGEGVEGMDGEISGGVWGRGRSHDGQRGGWVGFNDEVVIVLKEREESGQALVVYDFT
jgi:hypothetical protein